MYQTIPQLTNLLSFTLPDSFLLVVDIGHTLCRVSLYFIHPFHCYPLITINLWKRQQGPPLDESSDLEDCCCKLVHLVTIHSVAKQYRPRIVQPASWCHTRHNEGIWACWPHSEKWGQGPGNGKEEMVTWDFFVLPPLTSSTQAQKWSNAFGYMSP